MSLVLESVSVTYGLQTAFATRALIDVSVAVERGELVLVAGSTGSGKSTLLRVAAGLLGSGSGRSTIDGEPLSAASARGKVGLIFQDAESQLFADSVAEDVAFGPRNLGADDSEALRMAEQALRSVGLDPAEYGSRSPFTLSGGEARRVAIAGVLAMQPRYVLADEPTAGLDARGRTLLSDILLELKATTGVVVVSHALEEFLGVADRVLMLRGGESHWYGPADALLADPTPMLEAGLVPPDVVEVQRLVGGGSGRPCVLDPVAAAQLLLAERGA